VWHSGGAAGIAINTPLGLSKSEATTRDVIA